MANLAEIISLGGSVTTFCGLAILYRRINQQIKMLGPDAPRDSAPFALPGDVVTRENGEYVCTVAVPITRSSVISSKDFKDWAIPEPKAGDPILYEDNGKGWTRSTGPKGQIHVNGEWRPSCS